MQQLEDMLDNNKHEMDHLRRERSQLVEQQADLQQRVSEEAKVRP